jgi:hypothetical protein
MKWIENGNLVKSFHKLENGQVFIDLVTGHTCVKLDGATSYDCTPPDTIPMKERFLYYISDALCLVVSGFDFPDIARAGLLNLSKKP